jgi:hypothetical protein
VDSNLRSLHLALFRSLGPSYCYSPNCLEEVFSETKLPRLQFIGNLSCYIRILLIRNGERRRNMLPPEEELLSDQDLGEATVEQLINLRTRINLALLAREEQEQPQPGESLERPAID